MKCGQLMTRPVVATTPRATLRDVAAQLVSRGISGMPVTERDGKVVGIVTEHDVVAALLDGDGERLDDLKVRDVMQKDVIAVDVEEDVREALKAFKERHIVRVPVVQDGKLVGILARTDALRGYLDEPEFLLF